MSSVITVETVDQLAVLHEAPQSAVWATAEHCVPCQQLFPELEKLAAEELQDWAIARVDVEKHPALAEELQVLSLPTLVLFHHATRTKSVAGNLSARKLRKAFGL